MRSREDIEKDIQRLANRSFWLGVILGLLGGLAIGFAIGYGPLEKTVVIPLTEGIKVWKEKACTGQVRLWIQPGHDTRHTQQVRTVPGLPPVFGRI